ncbi:hypothetical protein LSAT2_012280 [Lamellibrachia satsuma]|nr:hypothetical protein LSAT2_012280 [Lamellibrachia satsuma]
MSLQYHEGIPHCNATLSFVAHPSDCSLYYQCIFGRAVTERSCSHDTTELVFNPVSQRCDWPEEVACANATLASLFQ